MRILLVEDDVRLSAALVKLLQADNFAVIRLSMARMVRTRR